MENLLPLPSFTPETTKVLFETISETRIVCAPAGRKASCYIAPADGAKARELASIEATMDGGYGKGRSGVMRRFIENGIVRALEQHVIEKKNATDFGETVDDDGGEDD